MSNISRYKSRRGFTLIEILLSLSILIMIVYSALMVYRIALFENINPSMQLYIGIIQLREELLDVSELEVTHDSLSYIKEEKQFSLEHINQHLVKKPGTDIVLREIDELSFYIQDHSIYLSLKYHHKDYDFMITFVREKDEEV